MAAIKPPVFDSSGKKSRECGSFLWVVSFLFASFLFCVYDVVLIAMSPGTFLDNLTSFSHIWLLPAGFCAGSAIYKLKTGHFWFSRLPGKLKAASISAVVFTAVICLACLVFIFSSEFNGATARDFSPDYLFLLGGGISADGRLPPAVQARIRTASVYLSSHPDVPVVVTGGRLKFLPYPEAPAIKDGLSAEGIPEDRILMEDRALDTIQNFKYSAFLISGQQGVPLPEVLSGNIIVVTSRFHMSRALYIAARLGFSSVKGISVPTPVFYIPHLYLREICACLKLFARIIFTGEPSPMV